MCDCTIKEKLGECLKESTLKISFMVRLVGYAFYFFDALNGFNWYEKLSSHSNEFMAYFLELMHLLFNNYLIPSYTYLVLIAEVCSYCSQNHSQNLKQILISLSLIEISFSTLNFSLFY